jgi:ATP-binding cassette subfamily B protein
MDLARVRALVDQHAGSLAIERLPGGSGTSYVLEFPLRAVATPGQPVPALPGRAPDRPAILDARALEGASILVVDDQQDARDLLSAVLMRQGARVQALGEGVEAIRWFEEHPATAWPDLLICDIALADTDGYRVVRQIRAMEARQAVPVTERIPAIALTGFAGPEDRTRALLAGFQLHLGKPVEPSELLAAAASLIGTERAGQRRARAILPPGE